jgi:uncharacterized protein YxjI
VNLAVQVVRPTLDEVRHVTDIRTPACQRPRGHPRAVFLDSVTPMARYVMKEKWLAFGDDFWIEDELNARVYRVDGKALRLRKTLKLEDIEGNELCKIQERKLRVRDTMEIEAPDGSRLGLIQKALITPLRERFEVEVPGRPELKVRGNILDHEYKIEREGGKIAEVSKKWLRMRDTYGIEIESGEDEVLILAIAVALDAMEHDRDAAPD